MIAKADMKTGLFYSEKASLIFLYISKESLSVCPLMKDFSFKDHAQLDKYALSFRLHSLLTYWISSKERKFKRKEIKIFLAPLECQRFRAETLA